MRLNDILFENDDNGVVDIESFAKEVFSQPFFKHNDPKHVFMSHDSKYQFKHSLLVDSIHNRQPRDSSPILHNMVDALSMKKFGEKIRSGTVFTYIHHPDFLQSSSTELLIRFNTLNVCIPKGDYKIFYAPKIDDMTVFYGTFPRKLAIQVLDKVKDDMRSSSNPLIGYIYNYLQEHYSLESSEKLYNTSTRLTILVSNLLQENIFLISKKTFAADTDQFIENVKEIFDDNKKNILERKFIDIIFNDVNYKVKFTPQILDEVIERFMRIMYRYMETLEYTAEQYVSRIEETQSLPEEKTGDEFMVSCEKFWLIKFPFYLKLFQSYYQK